MFLTRFLIPYSFYNFSLIIKQEKSKPSRVPDNNIINYPLLIKMRYLLRNRDTQLTHPRNHFRVSFLAIKVTHRGIEK